MDQISPGASLNSKTDKGSLMITEIGRISTLTKGSTGHDEEDNPILPRKPLEDEDAFY
jgi:hypothetical protein